MESLPGELGLHDHAFAALKIIWSHELLLSRESLWWLILCQKDRLRLGLVEL